MTCIGLLLCLAQMFEKTHLLLILGIVLITSSLLMSIRKKRKRSATAPTPIENVEQIKQHRGVRGDLENLMVEIEQLSKRFATQLDAKAMVIERLIEEADERIDQLSQLQNTADPAQPPTDTGEPSPQPPPAPQPNGDDDPLTKSVFELADEGTDPDEIARRLGEHVGKIELILALRNT